MKMEAVLLTSVRRLIVVVLTLGVMVWPLLVGQGGKVSASEVKLRTVLRVGDGGQQRSRHLKRISKAMAAEGCPVALEVLASNQPTPAGVDLEFSPFPIDQERQRLANFQLLVHARSIDGESHVAGAILVHGTSGIEDLTLLRGEAIGFVSPEAISGYQLPMELFVQAGVEVKPEQQIFGGTHSGAVALLLHREVQGVGVAAPLAKAWSGEGELAMIAESKPVVAGGWWLKKGMDASLKKACKKGITTLTGKALKPFPGWIGGFGE
ncbi:MAG: PhnD/SsuA/transferrin family substrate-binding protein [Magnetococcales bacterium]|nr:PhnD/SsuA/transferrin family substrate-binding protein [Magnetococcales bacterium]